MERLYFLIHVFLLKIFSIIFRKERQRMSLWTISLIFTTLLFPKDHKIPSVSKQQIQKVLELVCNMVTFQFTGSLHEKSAA